jgi:hypothetical protein
MKGFTVWTVGALSIAIFIFVSSIYYIGYKIDWTAVGICLTAFVAIWQLRENSDQKAKDRTLETKREVLLEGVRGMALATQAFSALLDLAIPSRDSSKLFQTAASQVTVAASVASLATAKAGKAFMDTIGPRMMEALKMRVKLDHVDRADPIFQKDHIEMAKYVLENAIEVSKALVRAVAAVRADVGIAREPEADFIAILYPDEELVRSVIDKVFG